MKTTKIKRFLQVIAVNLVICFILPLSLSVTAHASTTQKQNITFYIENQIINSDKATIRLVRGYTDHPSFKNLYTGNNKITVPEGTYMLSVIVDDGYKFSSDTYGDYVLEIKDPPPHDPSKDPLFGIYYKYCRETESLKIDSRCQNLTLVFSGEIEKDYSDNYKTSEEDFYKWFPDYKGKTFKYEFTQDDLPENCSYEITKNGKPLSPSDKLKVGDKLRVTQHNYRQNWFITGDSLNNIPFVYNASGELYVDYTITTDDIYPSRFDVPPDEHIIELSEKSSLCWHFSNPEIRTNIITNCEAGGNFYIYKVTLENNNKETLTRITSETRILPGDRLKLDPAPVTGWQFDRWNVEGGIVTANNYFIVTDNTVNITAVFTKKHDIASGSTSSVYGDVDNDGEISFSDVEELITLFLNDGSYSQKFDLDKSGYFDFDDVSTMITIFLNSLG